MYTFMVIFFFVNARCTLITGSRIFLEKNKIMTRGSTYRNFKNIDESEKNVSKLVNRNGRPGKYGLDFQVHGLASGNN